MLREFVLLRALRAELAEVTVLQAAAAAELSTKQGHVKECADRAAAVRAERDAVREKLAALRKKALEAEKALLDLARLKRLESQYGQKEPDPSPPVAVGRGNNVGTLGDFMKLVKDAKAAAEPVPVPQPRPKEQAAKEAPEWQRVSIALESDDEEETNEAPAPDTAEDPESIVIDASSPPPLPAPPGEAGAKLGEDGATTWPWFVECAYNEAEICKRGSILGRTQQKVCTALARHLAANPSIVVYLEGHSSGRDEDDNIAESRAANLATWLRQNSVRDSQVRLQLPAVRALPPADAPAPRPEKPAGAEDSEEEEEEEDDDDEDEEGAARMPERRVTVRPLREVRVMSGPIEGDLGQSEQPGIFFAPEDASLKSLGGAAVRIVQSMGRELQRVFADEGRHSILIEGHSDDGIEDPTLLTWLAGQRAQAVRQCLLAEVGEPPEAAAQAKEPKLPKSTSKSSTGGSQRLSSKEAASAKQQELSDGADPSKDDRFDYLLPPPPPPLLKEEEILWCSRGRSCRATEEWGLRGLNRRVQIFIL